MKFVLAIFLGLFAFESFAQNEQLINDLTFLAHDSLEGRATGSKGELIAATYIAKRFKEIGLSKKSDSYFQVFTKKTRLHPHDHKFQGPEITGRNVIGYLDQGANTTIVIGAHYDHLGWGEEGSLHTGEKAIHNGADDNASGIAAMLFIADQLKNRKLNNNILFIAFTGEEKGLLGSNHFVKNIPHPEKINFMINMDMVGRLNDQRKLAINGIGTSPAFGPAFEVNNSWDFDFVLDSTGVGPSDHTSFYLNQIPAIHFFTGQHAQYHKPEDDVELINFKGLHDISAFITSLILDLDQDEKLAFTKTNDPEQKRFSFKVTLGVIPDYLFEGTGLRLDGVKENKPAANAGIQKGDIIIQMKGQEIKTIHDYMAILKTLDKGDQIKTIVNRNGESIPLMVSFD